MHVGASYGRGVVDGGDDEALPGAAASGRGDAAAYWDRAVDLDDSRMAGPAGRPASRFGL